MARRAAEIENLAGASARVLLNRADHSGFHASQDLASLAKVADLGPVRTTGRGNGDRTAPAGDHSSRCNALSARGWVLDARDRPHQIGRTAAGLSGSPEPGSCLLGCPSGEIKKAPP